MKKCSACLDTKPFNQFCKMTSNHDGYHVMCKSCSKVRNKQYREANKLRLALKQKEQRNTPSVAVSQMVQNAKTRAKKKKVDFTISAKDVKELISKQNNKCAVTGFELEYTSGADNERSNPYKCSIDRIRPNEGYILSNIRLVCWVVNYMKSDRTDEEFHKWINVLHTAISSQASKEEGSTTIS